ncbi:transcriptional regulator with PAS, ATPase and Fis domain [Chryseobacterium defluvii]|uniref:Transcriptional regulator with PAS, ATPase and Fis domain n=1 Tax=Chryseobacterium defluvii TaxID=160396 RepID=A0A840KBW5_9FLAO|nr:transposase [Chryseobacterium defluvii]MBB4805274.1 transcriptional regulator with PAS, ATPase and Fis domain [Chryseobacterium defluvii]
MGLLIEKSVTENEIEMSRICNFFNSREEDILQMYQSKGLDTEVLLRWCKLLEYDFFRLYSQHLILYAPPSSRDYNQQVEDKKKKSTLPRFRKSLYTKEMIDFILEKIKKEEMTRAQVMGEYNIPKTTLYKWLRKYGNSKV